MAVTCRPLLFLAAGDAGGRVCFVVVAAGRGQVGDDDVLFLFVGLAPHLIHRLIELLVGGVQFRLMLEVLPSVEADLAAGAL